jgi:hypothetical protein
VIDARAPGDLSTMIAFYRLLILGICVFAAASSAKAQAVTGLVSGDSFNLYGLNIDVSGCTIGLNGATPIACAASNKLELLQIVSARDTITFEVIGYTSTNPSTTATSAALTATGSGLTQLNITLKVTSNGTEPNTKVTTGTLTTKGLDAYDFSSTGTTATASAAFSAGTSATTLTDALAPSVTTGTASSQTVSNGPNSFSPAAAAFTITDSLDLNPNGHTINALSFSSVALKLTTTPEPASVTVMLLALGGLTMVRRRRRTG